MFDEKKKSNYETEMNGKSAKGVTVSTFWMFVSDKWENRHKWMKTEWEKNETALTPYGSIDDGGDFSFKRTVNRLLQFRQDFRICASFLGSGYFHPTCTSTQFSKCQFHIFNKRRQCRGVDTLILILRTLHTIFVVKYISANNISVSAFAVIQYSFFSFEIPSKFVWRTYDVFYFRRGFSGELRTKPSLYPRCVAISSKPIFVSLFHPSPSIGFICSFGCVVGFDGFAHKCQKLDIPICYKRDAAKPNSNRQNVTINLKAFAI